MHKADVVQMGDDTVIKWLPTGSPRAKHELAALRAVRDIPGAVQLLSEPIAGPQNTVGLVMRRLPCYDIEGLGRKSGCVLMRQLLEVGLVMGASFNMAVVVLPW
jgi:hypothetical protein